MQQEEEVKKNLPTGQINEKEKGTLLLPLIIMQHPTQ